MSHVGLIATILACPLCMFVLDMPNWQLTMHNAAAAVHLAMCVVPTLQALAEAFRVNKSVTKVDLSCNNFGDEGLKARAQKWGPRLGGCGTVGLRGETTAVQQRCCMKHDVLGACLKL